MATRNHLNVQELCRTGSSPHWEQLSEKLAHLSPLAAFQRGSLAPHPGSTVVLDLIVEVWVSQPKGFSVGELTLPLVCHGVAQA